MVVRTDAAGARTPQAAMRTNTPISPARASRARTKPALPNRPQKGLLAGMRVRKKLLFLHTCFSLALAAVLLVALRPAIDRVVAQSERAKARALLAVLPADSADERALVIDGVTEVVSGDGAAIGLTEEDIADARAADGPVVVSSDEFGRTRLAVARDDGTVMVAVTAVPEAREATARVYLLLVSALLVVYMLIAAALEVFVLPQHVYGPISRMLRADRAVQEGDQGRELIPTEEIPADELGAIMRSRNESVLALRRHEAALARALDQVETVAADLKRKNHLLETARRNLEGADRLASLGMMSAGIAHELNTPLSVVKGLTEKLAADPARGLPDAEAQLLARVVGRLERLGESLLDFARARETRARPVALGTLVDEAITLVRIDRETGAMPIENRVDPGLIAEVDADRVIQVFVNLIRNAVDAVRKAAVGGVGGNGQGGRSGALRREESGGASLREPLSRPSGAPSPRGGEGGEGPAGVRVEAEPLERDGVGWVCLRVVDEGPGIAPSMLSRLFEPFVSDTLDARGTGLGLAVAEGIVREHGGTLIARNRRDRRGAIFEIMLPERRVWTASAEETTA